MVFLSQEREKNIEDIISSLHSAKTINYTSEQYCRIVESPYTKRPLCTKGSVLHFGGRFNFGNITSSLEQFECLYLANNHGTAFAEKYLLEKGSESGEGQLSPEDIKFQEPKGYMQGKQKFKVYYIPLVGKRKGII